MKHTYRTCDRCGTKLSDDCEPLYITVDWQSDPAGGRSENIQREIDQCHHCLSLLVMDLLEKMQLDERKKLVARMRMKLEKRRETNEV